MKMSVRSRQLVDVHHFQIAEWKAPQWRSKAPEHLLFFATLLPMLQLLLISSVPPYQCSPTPWSTAWLAHRSLVKMTKADKIILDKMLRGRSSVRWRDDRFFVNGLNLRHFWVWNRRNRFFARVWCRKRSFWWKNDWIFVNGFDLTHFWHWDENHVLFELLISLTYSYKCGPILVFHHLKPREMITHPNGNWFRQQKVVVVVRRIANRFRLVCYISHEGRSTTRLLAQSTLIWAGESNHLTKIHKLWFVKHQSSIWLGQAHMCLYPSLRKHVRTMTTVEQWLCSIN